MGTPDPWGGAPDPWAHTQTPPATQAPPGNPYGTPAQPGAPGGPDPWAQARGAAPAQPTAPDPWAHTRAPTPGQPVPANPYSNPYAAPNAYGPTTTSPTTGPYQPYAQPRPVPGNPYAGYPAPNQPVGPSTPQGYAANGASRGHLGTARFGGAPEAPAMRSSVSSLGEKALKLLKRAGKLSLGLAPAIAICGGMLANEPGMAQAVSVWQSGMAQRLDGGMKNLLPQLRDTAKDGWIAMDRDEFDRVLWTFQRESEVLRNVLNTGGSSLDEVAAAYRSFWTWVMRTALTALGVLVVAKALQRAPQSAVWGVLMEKYITAEVNIATLLLATSMASTLKEGGEVLSTMVKRNHQWNYITPNGDAAVDFKSIVIDADKYPSFSEPAKKHGLPPRYQDFDWIEPKREISGP
ncbi:hypothetical protein ACIBQ1_17350 [Nonomuraea sp. NPDC050153]|uniref:hypothetical protein n=1 Tax=Nonomuraea sp. NPDC050153 TaxID=3364359 RepID=UPI0037A5FA5D